MLMTGGWFIIVLTLMCFFLWSTFFSFLKDNIFSSAKFVRNRGVQILGLFLLLATLSSLFLLLASEILWIGSCFPAFFPLGFPSDCVGFFSWHKWRCKRKPICGNAFGNNTCVALVVASCLNPHILLVHLPCLVLEYPAALLYARMCLERSLFRWVNKGGKNYLEW